MLEDTAHAGGVCHSASREGQDGGASAIAKALAFAHGPGKDRLALVIAVLRLSIW